MTTYQLKRVYYDNTPNRCYGHFNDYEDIKQLVKGFKADMRFWNENVQAYTRKNCKYFYIVIINN